MTSRVNGECSIEHSQYELNDRYFKGAVSIRKGAEGNEKIVESKLVIIGSSQTEQK